MLVGALETYCFQVYAEEPHPALGEAPRKAFEKGLRLTGEVAHRIVRFDWNFLISTLPSAPYSGGTAKVQDNGKGIQIKNILYWHPEFRMRTLVGTRVAVRVDPHDVSHVFAWKPDTKEWLECVSNHHQLFRGRSWREINILSKELAKTAGRGRKSPKITAARLAPFLSGAMQLEEARIQHQRDVARAEAGLHGATPRLVFQDGIRVGEPPESRSAPEPAAFSVDDWNNSSSLEDFE